METMQALRMHSMSSQAQRRYALYTAEVSERLYKSVLLVDTAFFPSETGLSYLAVTATNC